MLLKVFLTLLRFWCSEIKLNRLSRYQSCCIINIFEQPLPWASRGGRPDTRSSCNRGLALASVTQFSALDIYSGLQVPTSSLDFRIPIPKLQKITKIEPAECPHIDFYVTLGACWSQFPIKCPSLFEKGWKPKSVGKTNINSIFWLPTSSRDPSSIHPTNIYIYME